VFRSQRATSPAFNSASPKSLMDSGRTSRRPNRRDASPCNQKAVGDRPQVFHALRKSIIPSWPGRRSRPTTRGNRSSLRQRSAKNCPIVASPGHSPRRLRFSRGRWRLLFQMRIPRSRPRHLQESSTDLFRNAPLIRAAQHSSYREALGRAPVVLAFEYANGVMSAKPSGCDEVATLG
jgi:hypothetical protein